MKLELIVEQRFFCRREEPSVPYAKREVADKPNYLVYETSRRVASGFAVRVGTGADVFLQFDRTMRCLSEQGGTPASLGELVKGNASTCDGNVSRRDG